MPCSSQPVEEPWWTGKAGSSGETGPQADTPVEGGQGGIHRPGGTYPAGSPLHRRTGCGIQTRRALSLGCSESANTACKNARL